MPALTSKLLPTLDSSSVVGAGDAAGVTIFGGSGGDKIFLGLGAAGVIGPAEGDGTGTAGEVASRTAFVFAELRLTKGKVTVVMLMAAPLLNRRMAHSVTDLFARAKDGDEIHRREVAPLKKSLAKRDQRIKELEGKLKTAEETGRRILERADLG
nr:hypothetical protein Iba_chr04aCG6380 [Ipomoea batatas]